MLSLRALTRSVPRFSRSIARTSLRPTTLAKPAIAQPWKQTIKPAYAAFSTTSVFREPAGEGELANSIVFQHSIWGCKSDRGVQFPMYSNA